MRNRLERLARVERAHAGLKAVCDVSLAALLRKQQALHARRESIAVLVSSESAPAGLLATAFRQIQSLANEIQSLAGLIDLEREKLADFSRKAEALDRLTGALALNIQSHDERAALEEVSVRLATTACRKASRE